MRRPWAALSLLGALASAPNPAAACPPGIFWPDPDWRVERATGPAAQALNDYAFTLTGRDEERRGIRTDGVVVVHQGRIVYERYGR